LLEAAMTDLVARADMLIRRPVAEVFDAFVRPEMITQFWLESTSGPLRQGAKVEWRFMVPGAVETVTVTAFENRRRISFDWSDSISVNMQFEELNDGTTRVTVEAAGFKGDQPESEVVNATEGFTIVLCDLKILLEIGRSGNLVRDKAELIGRS
jgi:uncharacterized protein YndB with AHSA1/START domain